MKLKQGYLVVLSAPSGTGKTTICKKLLELNKDWRFSVSATTRDKRKNEKEENFLLRISRNGTRWHEDEYTAVGFPKVFYLKYHGYSSYFPLWALARYRSLQKRNDNDKLDCGI